MRKRQVRTCILLFCVYTDFFTWMYTEFYTFGPWCLHYPQCSCHWRQLTTLHAAPSGATEMFHTTFIHAAESLLSLLPRLSSRLLVSPSERLHQPAERRHPSVPSQHDRTQLQEDLLLQHDEGQPGPHQRWSDRSDGRHLHGKQWVSARGRIPNNIEKWRSSKMFFDLRSSALHQQSWCVEWPVSPISTKLIGCSKSSGGRTRKWAALGETVSVWTAR